MANIVDFLTRNLSKHKRLQNVPVPVIEEILNQAIASINDLSIANDDLAYTTLLETEDLEACDTCLELGEVGYLADPDIYMCESCLEEALAQHLHEVEAAEAKKTKTTKKGATILRLVPPEPDNDPNSEGTK
jgi:hypothetical protein